MDLAADLKEFEALLDNELKKAGEKIGKDSDTSAQAAGASFEYLIASWFVTAEPDFDQKTPDEANVGNWGGSTDLQCDLWFENRDENKKVIVDTKWRSSTLRTGDYTPFFGAWKIHIDPAARREGNESIQRKLENFENFMSDPVNCVEYRLVSNQKLAKAGQAALARANEELERAYGPDTKHSITVIDRHELYQYYREANSVLLDIPPELEIPIAGQPFIQITDPLKSVVVAIPGTELANLYHDYGRGLFSYNIRSYIGPGKINSKVRDSAQNDPDLFFYRNNGISALCTNLEVKDSSIQVDEFQIVNGAQTVGSLYKANSAEEKAGNDGLSDRLLVLARVIEIDPEDLKSESEDSITRSIILANNTQTKIRIQDNYSNLPLQRFLEKQFVNTTENALFKPYRYAPKRSADTHSMGIDIERPSGALVIEPKDLAKLRYAYLSDDPMLTQGGQSNALTTPPTELEYQEYLAKREKRIRNGDDPNIGAPPYVRAFGVDGRLVDIWAPGALRQAQFAYAVARHVKSYGDYLTGLDKDGIDKNDKYKPLYRCFPVFDYHVIAMYGAWLRESQTEDWAIALLDRPNQCKAVFDEILGESAMVKVYETYNDLLDQRKQLDSIRVESGPYARMKENFFAECQRKWSNPDDLLRDSDPTDSDS